jgi:hypothetical protein
MADLDLVWDDDLSWCPSQCTAEVRWPDGTPAVLYLRWRHPDPWSASVITVHDRAVPISAPAATWRDVTIGAWRDDQLAEAKAELVKVWDALVQAAKEGPGHG